MSITYATGRDVASKAKPPSVTVPTGNTWVRPSDWLTLPTVGPTDQKMVGLYAVFDTDSNYIALTATTQFGADFLVDWGDGTVTSYASGTTAQYKYTYSSISSGTLTTRGYKQVIVTVTSTSGNLTQISLNKKYVLTPIALPKYDAKWLDVTMGSPFLDVAYVTPNNSEVSAHMLEQFTLVSKSSNFNTFTDFFYICTGLRKVNILADMFDVYYTNAMFYFCTSLETVPFFNTSNVLNMAYMFGNCYNLKTVPQYETYNVTDMSNMFLNCKNLVDVPQFNTPLLTNTVTMFSGCNNLQKAPLLNTANVTNSALMFQTCFQLTEVPLYNTVNVANMSGMFTNAVSLKTIPQLDTSNTANTNGMFFNCYGLTTIPALNLNKVTDSAFMFQNCNSLQTMNDLNLSNSTTTNSMFVSCTSLKQIGNINIPNVTTTASMFSGCNGLVNIGSITTTTKLNTTTSMFQSCQSLPAVPLFDTSNVTTSTSMFSSCSSLESQGLPSFNFANCVTTTSMFASCVNLITIPTYNFSKATTVTTMFSGANSLVSLPAFNLSNVTVSPTTFAGGATNLARCDVTGLKFAVSYANDMLSKDGLENIFTNLGTAATAQAITITSNYGADTVVTKTSTTSTSSKTVTISIAGNVTVGMYMTGTAVAPVSCSFTDAGDTVTVAGFSAWVPGTLVAFPTITSTTGITINTLYYIINVAGSTFQVSLTPGGSAVPLTTNGTGTVKWAVKVTNVAGTTLTVDNYPMLTSTTSQTYRLLNVPLATFKNWTVTG